MGRLGIKGPAGFCGHLTILGQLGQKIVKYFQAKTLAEDAKICRASAEIREPAALKLLWCLALKFILNQNFSAI